jgi:hypothetical protein
MLALVDFILSLGELFLSWRFYVGLALTAAACWLVFVVVPEPAQWFFAVPIGLVGIFLSFRSQICADEASVAKS